MPLLTAPTVQKLLVGHRRAGRDITVLAVNIEKPKGYGRIIVNKNGQMEGIVEEVDADKHQKDITLINSGIYCVKKTVLENVLAQVESDNAQNEFYLTDIIGIGHRQGFRLGVETGKDAQEVIGINDVAQLVRAEKILLAKAGETA